MIQYNEALPAIIVAVVPTEGPICLVLIHNTDAAKEAIVGLNIEERDIDIEGAMALTDADAILKAAPINRYYSGEPINGTYLIVATDGRSLDESLVDSIHLKYDDVIGRALLSI